MPSFRNEVKLISMIQIKLFYLTILNMQRYAYHKNKREHGIYVCKVKFERQNETSRTYPINIHTTILLFKNSHKRNSSHCVFNSVRDVSSDSI